MKYTSIAGQATGVKVSTFDLKIIEILTILTEKHRGVINQALKSITAYMTEFMR